MRELFDQLASEGEAGIDRLVSERTQETVQLDFKEKRDPSNGAFQGDDRKTFAKALSAFSNSNGGLLVFGVEARKGADDVDCAQAPKPIAEIERFLSEAITASGQLLQPRHEGIEVRAIQSTRQPGSGYLLVHVKRSERRPHRSEAAGQKQYFKRAGDNSFEMEHYDIEDAFRRVSVPSLSWELKSSGSVRSGTLVFSLLDIVLINVSSFTAKFPYVHLAHPQAVRFDRTQGSMFSVSQIDQWTTFSGSDNAVIHPGLKLKACRITIEHRTGSISDKNVLFSFSIRYGCENSSIKEDQFSSRVGLHAADL